MLYNINKENEKRSCVMQTKECIAKRRSIRGYNGESVSREEVLHLVEYAALAR